jgi:hypothetical protein
MAPWPGGPDCIFWCKWLLHCTALGLPLQPLCPSLWLLLPLLTIIKFEKPLFLQGSNFWAVEKLFYGSKGISSQFITIYRKTQQRSLSVTKFENWGCHKYTKKRRRASSEISSCVSNVVVVGRYWLVFHRNLLPPSSGR